MSTVENGQKVSVHYVGTLDDGTEFDSSHSRGEPIMFEVGSGQLIAGFDSSIVGMAVGETKEITLGPTEAYGEANPELLQSFPQASFPPDFNFEVGEVVQGQNQAGQPVFAKIDSVGDEDVVLDLNHPMAGKTLNFAIELVSIVEQEEQEESEESATEE